MLCSDIKEEVNAKKKGAKQEAYKTDKLMRHKFSNYRLVRLTSNKIAKLKNELAVTSAPATVNKYLTLISVALNTAKNKWDIFLLTNVCSNLKRLAEPEVKDIRLEPAESSFKFNGNCLCLVINYYRLTSKMYSRKTIFIVIFFRFYLINSSQQLLHNKIR